jgi:hypothetical protein
MNTLSESKQQAVCEMPPHFPKCLSQAVAWDTAVCEYANAHQLSIDDALEYLSECHNCGKSLDDNYDGIGHRYCSERCQYYCEDFHYTCFREGNCRVCPRDKDPDYDSLAIPNLEDSRERDEQTILFTTELQKYKNTLDDLVSSPISAICTEGVGSNICSDCWDTCGIVPPSRSQHNDALYGSTKFDDPLLHLYDGTEYEQGSKRGGTPLYTQCAICDGNFHIADMATIDDTHLVCTDCFYDEENNWLTCANCGAFSGANMFCDHCATSFASRCFRCSGDDAKPSDFYYKVIGDTDTSELAKSDGFATLLDGRQSPSTSELAKSDGFATLLDGRQSPSTSELAKSGGFATLLACAHCYQSLQCLDCHTFADYRLREQKCFDCHFKKPLRPQKSLDDHLLKIIAIQRLSPKHFDVLVRYAALCEFTIFDAYHYKSRCHWSGCYAEIPSVSWNADELNQFCSRRHYECFDEYNNHHDYDTIHEEYECLTCRACKSPHKRNVLLGVSK